MGGLLRGRNDAYTLTNFWEQTVSTRGRRMKNSLVFCPSFAFTTPRLCLCIRRNYLGPSIIFPFPQPLSTHACADFGFLYPRWRSWYLQSHSSTKPFLTFRITSPFYFWNHELVHISENIKCKYLFFVYSCFALQQIIDNHIVNIHEVTDEFGVLLSPTRHALFTAF